MVSHALYSILITVVDAYLPVVPEALLLVNAFKQLFAFGFAYGIVPWMGKGRVRCHGWDSNITHAVWISPLLLRKAD
jgi:hypothetical protein